MKSGKLAAVSTKIVQYTHHTLSTAQTQRSEKDKGETIRHSLLWKEHFFRGVAAD